MKALTLTEPYASLVALRQKEVETRSWTTSYRGPLAIHAAKGFPKWAKETAQEPEFASALKYETGSYDPALRIGRILCVVELVAVHATESVRGRLSEKELQFGDYHDGRFAWMLRYSHPVIEIPLVRGALGLWNWDMHK